MDRGGEGQRRRLPDREERGDHGKCREGMKDEKALSSQIDGMGLVNVFVRLKLFFGENMTYHIEALEGKIVIGGCINGDAGTV